MAKQCEDICKDFEGHQLPRTIREWEVMKRRWEVDPSQPDPYQVTEKGETVVYANL